MHPVGNGLGATVTPLDLLPPPLVLPAATSYWQVAFFCVGVPPESFLTRLFPNEVTSNSIAGRPAVHPGQWCCMRQKQRGRTSRPGPVSRPAPVYLQPAARGFPETVTPLDLLPPELVLPATSNLNWHKALGCPLPVPPLMLFFSVKPAVTRCIPSPRLPIAVFSVVVPPPERRNPA